MSAPAARVLAQAKINLGLRVLAREESGYHGIETLFARLALADEVLVRVDGSARSLRCDGPRCPADGLGGTARNLAFRAAVAFADAVGWPTDFSIRIRKHIPVGGGLGGGSADAGAVLRALNALAPAPLDESALLRVAARLGSDVPFLASEAPLALAWSRGERMLQLAALPERPAVLVVPPFAVATRDAYGWLAESRPDHTPAPLLTPLRAFQSWEACAPYVENDFEPAVGQRHPWVAEAIAALRLAGALIARMSGSGSTVYGIFDAPPDLAAVARNVTGEVLLTRVVPYVVPVEPAE